jgi:hypothetical protein
VSDADLRYRPGAVDPDDLKIGECTIRRVSRWGQGTILGEENAERDGIPVSLGWLLWFCVPRDSDRQQELFAVQVNPNGPYLEKDGTRRRTWGLAKAGEGTWQISPSINFEGIWHHTPAIVGVPDGEPWQC